MKYLILISFFNIFFYNSTAICNKNKHSNEVKFTIFVNRTSVSIDSSEVEILFRLKFLKDLPMCVNENISADFRENGGIILYIKKDSTYYSDIIIRRSSMHKYKKIKDGLEIITTFKVDFSKIYPKDKLFDKENKRLIIPDYLNDNYGCYQIQAMYFDNSSCTRNILKGTYYSNVIDIEYLK